MPSWWRAVRGGRTQAYEVLVARYQGHVYGLAYSMVDNWADAQDVAQEAFIRAYVNLDQLQAPERFAAWLRRVAFSVTMNWMRAYRPQLFERLDGRVDLESLDIPDFRPGPPEVVERRELAQVVLRAVASLPAKYRVPLTMFHLDRLSYQKVAEFLDIPLGTAKALIHRARARLHAALAPHVTEEVAPMVQEVFNEHKLPAEFARKVVENVPRLAWRQGRENTFIGALAAAANAMGDDVSYDYVMGVSGAAFKVHLCQPEWCPSAADAGPGFNCATTAVEALGYVTETVFSNREKPEEVQKVREAVVSSIDKGRPVVAINLIRSDDWGVITGYADNGNTFLCRTYFDSGEEYAEADRWPWITVVIGERKKPPARKQLLKGSLELAVKLAKTRNFKNYLSGFAAYRNWALQLLEEARFKGRRLQQSLHASAFTYMILADGRAAASRYLRSIASAFRAPARQHLLDAAGIYEQVVGALEAGRSNVPWPFSGKVRAWPKKQRQAQAETLKQVLALEKKAIADIEKALAATQSTPGFP